MVLVLREVSNVLAVVYVMRDENEMKMNKGLQDYNFAVIRKGKTTY